MQIPIYKIIETVRSSGNYAFYRRFEEKYGVTPPINIANRLKAENDTLAGQYFRCTGEVTR